MVTLFATNFLHISGLPMKGPPMKPLLAAALIFGLAACHHGATKTADNDQTKAIEHDVGALIKGKWRSEENIARNRYRHPAQTLAFFGIKPTMTVIEIWPGAGWYSEILAPYLRDEGHYIAAVDDPA